MSRINLLGISSRAVRGLLPEERLNGCKGRGEARHCANRDDGQLVLGLLIASAKRTNDTRRTQYHLTRPHFLRIKVQREGFVSSAAGLGWRPPSTSFGPATGPRRSIEEQPRKKLTTLISSNSRRKAKLSTPCSRALTIALDFVAPRESCSLGSSIPVLFLVVLVFWLTIIFASFGLLPPKRNVITAFFVCALPVSGAISLDPGARPLVQ
jgi:hypothetical protein